MDLSQSGDLSLGEDVAIAAIVALSGRPDYAPAGAPQAECGQAQDVGKQWKTRAIGGLFVSFFLDDKW